MSQGWWFHSQLLLSHVIFVSLGETLNPKLVLLVLMVNVCRVEALITVNKLLL